MTALSLFGTKVASTTLSTAGTLATAAGGVSSSSTVLVDTTGINFGQLYALGNAGAWPNLGSIGSPDGNGFLFDVTTLEGQQILAGTWTPTSRVSTSAGTATADIITRVFVWMGPGLYAPFNTWIAPGVALSTVAATASPPAVALPVLNFNVGHKLYMDVWANVTVNGLSAGATIKLSLSSTALGIANDTQTVTPGFSPTPPIAGVRWLPRSLGGTVVDRYTPRGLGSTLIFPLPPKVTPSYIPRALGGTVIFPGHPKYIPRTLGSTIGLPLVIASAGTAITGLAVSQYLESVASKGWAEEKSFSAAVSTAQARSTSLSSIRFGLVKFVPRILGGTLNVPSLAAQVKFLQSSRFGLTKYVPRALGGTLILPSLAARETSVASTKFGTVRLVPRVFGGTLTLSSLAAKTTDLVSSRFGQVRLVPRALGGTIILPSLEAKATFVEAAAQKAASRSNFLVSVASRAVSRAKAFISVRFGRIYYVPRALGGTIIGIPDSGPVAWTNFLIKVPGANAITGWAQATYKSAAVSSAQARAKFFSAARFGWVRLIPRALGGTIIYPSLEAREKSQVSIGQKAPARSSFIIRVAQRAQAQSKFLIQGLIIIVPFGKITHTAVNLLTTLRGATASFVPRTLGGTLLITIGKSLTSVAHSVGQALSSAVGRQSSLTLSGRVTLPLAIVHQAVSMAAPFSSILSTITVTDVNLALVSNASVCSVLVTFPDDTTSALSLGSGVTNLGSGQYQAKYNTKMPGIIREVWSITAADSITVATAQFLVGTEY
jgi:hypothetical protein